MPHVHLMNFEPTRNMCAHALLLVGVASAYGTVCNVQTMSVTKCEKDGKVYAERVPESKWSFKHLTKSEDMKVSRDGHSLLH